MGSQDNRHDEARNSVLARATMAAMAAAATWRETGREGRSGDPDAPHPPRAAEDASPADPSRALGTVPTSGRRVDSSMIGTALESKWPRQ